MPWSATGVGGMLSRIPVTKGVEKTLPASVELDDEGPVVFGVLSGDPELVRIPNERPPNITKEATGQPLCRVNVINDFQQYQTPMRYPGVLNSVQCGDCDECPEGTTWAPVYVTMPVLTAMCDENDPLTDQSYYVMDMVTVPVTCSCQRK